MLPNRVLPALGAAILGAALYVGIFAVALGICLVITLQGMLWFQTGSFDLTVPQAQRAGHRAEVAVAGATSFETRAINNALATLRYRPPPGAVHYEVSSDLGPDTGGDFVSGINLIQVKKSIVHGEGVLLRRTLAHEIGHYVDFNMLTDQQRARFAQLRGIPRTRIWGDTSEPWSKSPSEDFAEVFASLDTPNAQGRPTTVYGPVVHAAAIEKLLRDAGVRFGRPEPPPTTQSVVRRQVIVATHLLGNGRNRWLLMVGAVVSAVYGALTWGARSWRHTAWMRAL